MSPIHCPLNRTRKNKFPPTFHKSLSGKCAYYIQGRSVIVIKDLNCVYYATIEITTHINLMRIKLLSELQRSSLRLSGINYDRVCVTHTQRITIWTKTSAYSPVQLLVVSEYNEH